MHAGEARHIMDGASCGRIDSSPRKTFAVGRPEARGAGGRRQTDHNPVVSSLPRSLEARGLELVGHTDLRGKGDGMQIMRNGDVVYVGHMGDFGIGTSVVDVSDLAHPRVLRQIPVPSGTHSHKVQLAGDLLLANHEQYPYRVGVPESSGLVV